MLLEIGGHSLSFPPLSPLSLFDVIFIQLNSVKCMPNAVSIIMTFFLVSISHRLENRNETYNSSQRSTPVRFERDSKLRPPACLLWHNSISYRLGNTGSRILLYQFISSYFPSRQYYGENVLLVHVFVVENVRTIFAAVAIFRSKSTQMQNIGGGWKALMLPCLIDLADVNIAAFLVRELGRY